MKAAGFTYICNEASASDIKLEECIGNLEHAAQQPAICLEAAHIMRQELLWRH